MLGDCSVHLMPQVKAALLERSYILVGSGWGVRGNIEINATDIHPPLKKKYREIEQELMIAQLRSDHSKIPQPSCNDTMRIFVDIICLKNITCSSSINIDIPITYGALWITNGSEGISVLMKSILFRNAE